MTVSTTPGTLYFITEHDPFGERDAPYVKIGLVRENEAGRSSNDRLLEHQTGNPRSLVVAGSISTSAPISAFESAVHQRLAAHRVSGEWFRSGDDGIRPFIEAAEQIRADLEGLEAWASDLRSLSADEDSGRERQPDSEAEDLHCGAVSLISRIQELDQRQSLITMQLRALGGDEASDIEGICRHQLTRGVNRFDSARFGKAHPGLMQQLGSSHISGVFRLRRRPIAGRSEEFQKLKLICNDQKVSETGPMDLGRSSGAERLHAEWIELHGQLQPMKLQLKAHETRLRLICGPDAGIEGICSWKRAPRLTITRNALAERHPELAEEFTVISGARWSFRVNAWRPYRF